jgi:hypothetical protein
VLFVASFALAKAPAVAQTTTKVGSVVQATRSQTTTPRSSVRGPAIGQTTRLVPSSTLMSTTFPPTSRVVPEYLLPVEAGLRRIRISIAAAYEGDDEGPSPVSVSFACTAARLFGYIVRSAETPLSFSLFHNDGPLILTFEIKPKSTCQLRVDGDGVSQILSNGLPLRTAAVSSSEPRTIANLSMESDSVVDITVVRTIESADAIRPSEFSVDSTPTTSSTSTTVLGPAATSTFSTGSPTPTPPTSQFVEPFAPGPASQLVRFREVVQTSANEQIRMEKSRCTGTPEPNPTKSTQTVSGRYSNEGTHPTLPGVVCAYSFTGVGFDLTDRLVVLLNGAEPRLTALRNTLSVAVPQDTHTNLRVFLRPTPAELFPGSRAPRTTTTSVLTPITAPQVPTSTQAAPRQVSTTKLTINTTIRPVASRPVTPTTIKRVA